MFTATTTADPDEHERRRRPWWLSSGCGSRLVGLTNEIQRRTKRHRAFA